MKNRQSAPSKNFKKLSEGIQNMELFHEDFDCTENLTIKKYFLNFNLKSEKFSIFDEETTKLFLDFYEEKKYDFLLDIKNFTKNFFLLSSHFANNGFKHLPTNKFFLKNESFWLESFHHFFVDRYKKDVQNDTDKSMRFYNNDEELQNFYDKSTSFIDNDPTRITTRTEKMLIKCLPYKLDKQKYNSFVKCFYENNTRNDSSTIWSEIHDFLEASERIMNIIASVTNTRLIEQALIVTNIFYFQLYDNKVQTRLPSYLDNLNVSVRTLNKYSINQLQSLTEFVMYSILSHSVLESKKKNNNSSNFVGSVKRIDVEKFKKKLTELNELKNSTVNIIYEIINDHIKVQMKLKNNHIGHENCSSEESIDDCIDDYSEDDEIPVTSLDTKKRKSIIRFLKSQKKYANYSNFVKTNLSSNMSSFIFRIKDLMNKQGLSYEKWIPFKISEVNLRKKKKKKKKKKKIMIITIVVIVVLIIMMMVMIHKKYKIIWYLN